MTEPERASRFVGALVAEIVILVLKGGIAGIGAYLMLRLFGVWPA